MSKSRIPKIEVMGPYKPTGKFFDGWYYRNGTKVEVHLQAMGPDGLMHYRITIPAIKKAPQ